jgi:hypothetical protein
MNPTKTFLAAMFFMLACTLSVRSASAERVEPTGRNTLINAAFDKTSPPSQVDVWTNESGGYDTSNPGLWGRNSWVCLSSTNADTGECPTLPVWNSYGDVSIPIAFTEKRSGIKQIVNMQTKHRTRYPNGSGCGEYSSDIKVYSASIFGCQDGSSTSESQLTAYFTSAELAKLPVGGIWVANLKLILMQWDQPRNYPLGDWNATITLHVTDNNNQQIYLPEFGEAAPRVDLNMRPLPGTHGNQTQMTGAANIDMCLYDGYGSNSSSFTLKFDDQQQGTTQRNSGYFSIYSDHGDVNLDSGRIDFYVRMQGPDGKYVSVIRGEDLVIPDIQTANIRPVHLPGIPLAVLCIPTPLQLSTKTININSKQAGHYTGHLIVTFTPQL